MGKYDGRNLAGLVRRTDRQRASVRNMELQLEAAQRKLLSLEAYRQCGATVKSAGWRRGKQCSQYQASEFCPVHTRQRANE